MWAHSTPSEAGAWLARGVRTQCSVYTGPAPATRPAQAEHPPSGCDCSRKGVLFSDFSFREEEGNELETNVIKPEGYCLTRRVQHEVHGARGTRVPGKGEEEEEPGAEDKAVEK